MQGQGIRRHWHIGRTGHGSGPQVHVRLHHALRPAGRAAGVHDARQVITAAKGVVHRRSFTNQLLIGQHALRQWTVADMNQHWPYLGAAGDVFGHGQEGVVDQQDARVTVVQRVDDFRHAPANIDRVDHAAAPPGCQEILKEPVGVQAQQADAVAGLHPQLLQGPGQTSHPLGQFGIGAAAVAKDRRHGMGTLLQHAVQALGQIHGVLL
ncbi:hypothetical protein D3C86_875430 [compost metagenome]